MARPPKDIDAEQVEKLAAIGCTQDEIAGFFGVDQSTISRRFASEMALGRSRCGISLRRQQWKSARGGSVPMQIHLGKHYLGQHDKQSVQHSGTVGVSVQVYLPDNGRDAPTTTEVPAAE